MNIEEFKNIGGALLIAIIGSIVLAFPWFALFVIAGYFYFKEEKRAEKGNKPLTPETKD